MLIMKKFIVIILLVTAITILGIVFIHFTNDHVECEQKVETVIKADGTEVRTSKHICKERYNL